MLWGKLRLGCFNPSIALVYGHTPVQQNLDSTPVKCDVIGVDGRNFIVQNIPVLRKDFKPPRL